MAGTITMARTQRVSGNILLERWIQVDAGVDQIWTDLNTLDVATKQWSSQPFLLDGPSPGAYDSGQSDPEWYGREIRIPFEFVKEVGEWHLLDERVQEFLRATFPAEYAAKGRLIGEPNRIFTRPPKSDLANPAKFLLYDLEFSDD
jgi:hypothetical protein